MTKTLTPQDFYFESQGVLGVCLGARATPWLVNHLEKLSRIAVLRADRSDFELSASSSQVSSLRDTSVHLDVAAAIYRLLLEQDVGDVVSLSDCLGRACAAVLQPLAISGRCALEFYGEPDCLIPGADAFPVATIAVEAVTNALRHAHPAGVIGRLAIACRRKGNDIVMEVEDDGVGMPEGFDLRSDAGVGLRSAGEMANEIGATLSLDSRPLGLTVRLKMPAARSSAAPPSRIG